VLALEVSKAGADVATIRDDDQAMKVEFTMAEYNERVAKFWNALQPAINEVINREHPTSEEYRIALGWIAELGQTNEAPLFVDNFFENVVEKAAHAGLPGSEGTIQGPYYKPDAPMLTTKPFAMPMRPDEPGSRMLLRGQVLNLNHEPIGNALIDLWHSGNDGTYSSFVGDVPPMNLRARFHTDADGRFAVSTIRPVPYQIPIAGPVGRFLEMIGRHPWRPAHFHLRVSADGYQMLGTQIYFRGDKWLNEGDGDVSGGVKESLIIDVTEDHDEATAQEFNLPVPFWSTQYTFVLRSATA
jgi:catechol 1,2-dioxygenase